MRLSIAFSVAALASLVSGAAVVQPHDSLNERHSSIDARDEQNIDLAERDDSLEPYDFPSRDEIDFVEFQRDNATIDSADGSDNRIHIRFFTGGS